MKIGSRIVALLVNDDLAGALPLTGVLPIVVSGGLDEGVSHLDLGQRARTAR